jgi:hypothetical protein
VDGSGVGASGKQTQLKMEHPMQILKKSTISVMVAAAFAATNSIPSMALEVTYQPYIQPGDASDFAPHDLKVIAWQTDETTPNSASYTVEYGKNPNYGATAMAEGRVVDDYLSADPALPKPPTASGAHVNYYAVLKGLKYDTTYYYRVTGPGLPAGGFAASFHTRKQNGRFSFEVMGDEGFFPALPNSNPARRVNYEARIVHEMYEVHNLSIPGAPSLPEPDLALNTGDNVYFNGAEGSYRDFWMPVWNNDISSNETGAPFIRHIPYYIVAGNHDLGSTGISANLLGTANAGQYSGGTGGGDALQYFNNYYFPLNGPLGVDLQNIFNGDSSTPNGFYFEYNGVTYNSPTAIEAFRASTTVDTGKGSKRQIDSMGNYSFDQGNAHFVFLDGNPHLFDALLSYTPTYQSAPTGFPDYPGILRQWLIRDLDSTRQTWKIVVFHHPSFSSGNLTMRNFQMRRVAKLLEDHGVNVVFNGHEHNYQRTYPLHALASVADVPTTLGDPAVAIDDNFNGTDRTVPDGVIYLVEGAGGEGGHDNALEATRGSGKGVDQDDSATGSYSYGPGLTFPNGPDSWLDDHLTGAEMAPFMPNAGLGPKITARFKAKVFSFADVVINHNKLSLYQISEPLLATSSATPSNPAPYGTDVNGVPINDPIPDTLIDPATGQVVSDPAEGTSALLDMFTVTKPDVDETLKAKLSAPRIVMPGSRLSYTLSVDNHTGYALNGTQAVVRLPKGAVFAGALGDTVTRNGREVVVTIGRLEPEETRSIQVEVKVPAMSDDEAVLIASATIRSATAMPVETNDVRTRIEDHGREHTHRRSLRKEAHR